LTEALIAYEHGEPVSDASLKNLQDSKDQGKAAYIRAIRQDKLTPDQAKAASAKITGDSFEKELMRTQLAYRSGDKDAYRTLFPPERTTFLMAILTGAALAGLLGLGLLALGGALLMTGKWPTKGLPSEPFLPSDADRFALRFGLYLVIYLAAGLALAALLASVPLLGSAKTTIILGTVGLATLWMIQTKLLGVGKELRRVVGDLTQWRQHVAVGAAAFFANIPIIAVLSVIVSVVAAPFQQHLPSPSHPANEIMSQGGLLPLIFLYITAGIFAPLFEEITFRGLLFPALRRFVPLAGAFLLQGFAFAAIHPQGPLAWPMLASVGIVAAFVAHKQGSLIPAIVMHLIHNTAILTFGLVIM
jgi:membrane protease YdiL (CAAX protease family)